MNDPGKIERLDPAAGIPNAELVIECQHFGTGNVRSCAAWFDGTPGHISAASQRRVLAIVPEDAASGQVEIRLENEDGKTNPIRGLIGKRLAGELHPVANPAFDPDDGSLYVTRSGPRGQQTPVSIFRIDPSGELDAFSGEITNPTGIAFDEAGQMFVTSRLDGSVYKMGAFTEPVEFASNLGVATGIAFDGSGTMYVGDRTGTIFKINEVGEEQQWVHLEPSVAAYHLAFGPDGSLYVSGPTVSSYEVITRINQNGETSEFYKGLGRPQGLAFDTEGNLYVAASLRGRRGVVRITPDGVNAELMVSGMNVIGLAFGRAGDMVVATNEAVYSLPIGIQGALLSS